MTPAAVLLAGPSDTADAEALARVLQFFGVESKRLTVAELVEANAPEHAHVLSSAGAFIELAEAIERDPAVAAVWRNRIASAFVFAAGDDTMLAQAAEVLTGGRSVTISEVRVGSRWEVTTELPRFCRSLSGVVLIGEQAGSGIVLDGVAGSDAIIAAGHASAFTRLSFRSVPVYLSAGGIVDIDAPLSGTWFDIRAHLLDAAPIVMYVRAAFEPRAWATSEARACLVIDDPTLKPRYGFVNFSRLLAAMQRTDFATSIAFIPWNWRRSHRGTAELFRAHPERLSLSIHGCDHTSGEFAAEDRDWIAFKASQAAERMLGHETFTGIAHDRVIVFPQGAFSATAMDVLKHGPFMGVVNTEVASRPPIERAITIGDYWSVAVMRYSDFPIFTRRYPRAGVENFAFDILVGKPCIVVVHHGDCQGEFQSIADLVERLNALNAQLRWGSLGDVVRHSYSERARGDGFECRLFSPAARLKNTSLQPRTFHCQKQESEPDAIAGIGAGGTSIGFTRGEDGIEFEVTVPPGRHVDVEIAFVQPTVVSPPAAYNLSYKARTFARRQLCELRDNYLAWR